LRILLDTDALLWWLADERLTDRARDAIAEPDNLIMVSAAIAWEVTIKKHWANCRRGQASAAACCRGRC
jgi:PIN domain nuclease of toxin-antitoxin system